MKKWPHCWPKKISVQRFKSGQSEAPPASVAEATNAAQRYPANLRVLLTSNAPYLPPRGGSTRSNLAFLNGLVQQGHVCRVVAASPEASTPEQQARLRAELQEQQLDSSVVSKASRQTHWKGMLGSIEVVSVYDLLRHARELTSQIDEFAPEFVLVSSEDLSHTLLREAARSAGSRLVYLAHTPQWFPFGPASWNRDEHSAELVKNAAAIVVISNVMADYVEQHLGRRPFVVHPAIYGEPPWPQLGHYESGYIALLNPCQVKGISLFLTMADLFPARDFAALPSWGTNRQDLENLKRRRNVRLLPRVKDIEAFLSRTKLLLMPSLWMEGFGLIVMEAMLRGVPVIASDSGGLREAKAGTGYVIPVHPIQRYEATFDDRNMPRAVIPAQNAEPWAKAITELTQSRECYDREVHRARTAAENFVARIDPLAINHVLESLQPSTADRSLAPRHEVANLSEAKKALLLKRLKQRATERRG
jgi:glycosyltransferase involved in cell wall biosynthesis